MARNVLSIQADIVIIFLQHIYSRNNLQSPIFHYRPYLHPVSPTTVTLHTLSTSPVLLLPSLIQLCLPDLFAQY